MSLCPFVVLFGLKDSCRFVSIRGSKASLPRFVEEAGGGDLAGPAGAGGFAEVDDGVVGELGDLEGVGAVGFVAEIDAAV